MEGEIRACRSFAEVPLQPLLTSLFLYCCTLQAGLFNPIAIPCPESVLGLAVGPREAREDAELEAIDAQASLQVRKWPVSK